MESTSTVHKRSLRQNNQSTTSDDLGIGISHPDLRFMADKNCDFSLLNPHKKSHRRTKSDVTFSESVSRAVEHAEELVANLITKGWQVVHHMSLPAWLRDNDYLIFGHRPQIPSFKECFFSIFRMHTETLNIWTHLLGFVFFLVLSIWFLVQPGIDLDIEETFVCSVFFLSAILALGFSWIFHTVYCHSEGVKKFFNKQVLNPKFNKLIRLDYAGIAILTVGSFVPWLHFSFYCHQTHKIAYIISIFFLGIFCIVVSVQDSFQTAKYRVFRAMLFVALGLSGVIPCLHFIHLTGFWETLFFPPLKWLILMAFMYISGAVIYAARVPEKWYPGKFDIWFQSHQIFHVFVVLAALAHYRGIMLFADYRKEHKLCSGNAI